MKRILLLLLISFLGLTSFSQGTLPYAINQNLGSDSTLILVKNALQTHGVILLPFSDTTAANASHIAFYNAAVISTNGGQTVWYRYAGGWHILAGMGSTPSLQIVTTVGDTTNNNILLTDGHGFVDVSLSGSTNPSATIQSPLGQNRFITIDPSHIYFSHPISGSGNTTIDAPFYSNIIDSVHLPVNLSGTVITHINGFTADSTGSITGVGTIPTLDQVLGAGNSSTKNAYIDSLGFTGFGGSSGGFTYGLNTYSFLASTGKLRIGLQNLTGNREVFAPDADGEWVYSVNGVVPDGVGNVTIPTGSNDNLDSVTQRGNTTPLPIITDGYFTTNLLTGLSETGSSFGQLFLRDSINHAGAVYFGRGIHVLNNSMNDSVFYHPTTNAKDAFAYLSDINANTNGFLKNITGLVTAGTNVTIGGSGTSGSPYVINSTGGGTPVGGDKAIQYDSLGSFSGNTSTLSYDYSTSKLKIDSAQLYYSYPTIIPTRTPYIGAFNISTTMAPNEDIILSGNGQSAFGIDMPGGMNFHAQSDGPYPSADWGAISYRDSLPTEGIHSQFMLMRANAWVIEGGAFNWQIHNDGVGHTAFGCLVDTPFNPLNTIDIYNNIAIGGDYAQHITAPTNGMAIEGFSGFGNTSSPTLLTVGSSSSNIHGAFTGTLPQAIFSGTTSGTNAAVMIVGNKASPVLSFLDNPSTSYAYNVASTIGNIAGVNDYGGFSTTTGAVRSVAYTISQITGVQSTTLSGNYGIHTYNAGTDVTNILCNSDGTNTFNGAYSFPATIGTSGQSLAVPSSGTQLVWSSAGTGTITGVTAGLDLTGGGTSGTVTLNADTTTGSTKLATQGYVLRNAGGGSAGWNLTGTNTGVSAFGLSSNNSIPIYTNGVKRASFDSLGNLNLTLPTSGNTGNMGFRLTGGSGSSGMFEVVNGTGASGSFYPYFLTGSNAATSSFQVQANQGTSTSPAVIDLEPSNAAGTGAISNSSIGFQIGNFYTPLMVVLGNGNLGLGSSFTTPSSIFSINDKFQVDLNGNPIKINSVTTSFPSSQGGANTRLQNDGSGNLTWVSALSYTHTIFTPTTGNTVNLVNNQYNIVNPSGALLALTVALPSSPVNNDVVYIKFTQNITTVSYTNGSVIDGITAPTAGGLTVLTYDGGTTSWY